MNIIDLPPADLIPYARNPRKNDQAVASVAASIKEFGFKVPIVIDADNVIVCGHTRWKAAQKLGLKSVPCIIADDLSEEQIKAFRLLDNKVSEKADWDQELLALELGELDLDLTPFEIDFSDNLEVAPAEITEVEAPAPPEHPTTKPGDVWMCGEHRVMCGSSESADDIETLINNAQIALTLTDPPYNVAGDTEIYAANVSKSMNDLKHSQWDRDFEPAVFLSKTEQTRAKDSWLYVFTSHALFGAIVDWCNDNRSHASFVTWCKPNPMPCLSKKTWTFATELCVFSKTGSPTFNFPSEGHALNWISLEKYSDGSHPTQKPLKLFALIIERCTAPGAFVADWFLGSGTTLIAAEQLGRTCYGMEIAPRYCDVAVERWQIATGKDATLEATGETYESIRIRKTNERN